MAIRQEFQVPEDISERSPEEQEEWRQRELENKQRLTKEDLQDMLYKKRQENKLLRELEEGKKERPVKKPTERERIEEERRMADEFMSKQRGKKKKKEEEERKLEELMSDPSIMVQEPPGGYKCINQIGDKPCGEPATTKLLHGGLLGDTPPITLCKDCSKLMKLINIDFEDPELEKRLKKKQVDLELEQWDKAQEKARKKQKKEKTVSVTPTTQSLSTKQSVQILQKMIRLANKLDASGLHEEADLIDKLLI